MDIKDKLLTFFPEMSLYKKQASNLFSHLALPCYIRDYFIRRYSNQDGSYDSSLIAEKVKQLIPTKETWPLILDKIVLANKTETFLARIKININLKAAYVCFALPDLDVDFTQTLVSDDAWQAIKSENVFLDGDFWGVISINTLQLNKQRKIYMEKFVPFRPYRIDVNYFIEARKHFTLSEWEALILGAMDYNSEAFKSDEERLCMISRLLPFAEKRVNLIELAPKGTGKSYVYSRLSKYVWLNSGGIVTRAKLFYDMKNHAIGLLGCYDVVALDEIGTIKFNELSEIQGALKGYLENGEFAVGNKKNISSAGLVFLGNIKQENMDTTKNMVQELSSLFQDSALLDRVHGFIRGWDIPRMTESMKVNDLSMNSEYFTEILHLLRDDATYSKLVDDLLGEIDGDTRDISAVKKIATAYLKLLFPHYRRVEDVDINAFRTYCLNRAVMMRQDIKNQLQILDTEYKKVQMPIFKIKGE